MLSIKKKLSRYLSVSISLLLVSIFLVTDISVDNWISNEFDRAMVNKAGFLETLISEDKDGVEFEFADEFMPEFSGIKNPEYFQLWLGEQVFERSKTLSLFDVNDLPKLPIDKIKNQATPNKAAFNRIDRGMFKNITLPDGRSGRMFFTTFIPQIDSDDRDELGVAFDDFEKSQQPMSIAYATSNEEVNQILWLVDVIFAVTSVFTIIAIRMMVAKVVERGLNPLDQLNNELKKITLSSVSSALSTDNLPEELIPITTGINHFISENKTLYSREKRITSDIAHELKTPIAELLNLSEVAIKFPHEKQISDNYKTDVLAIAERLRGIVNGILLLQKSASTFELSTQRIEVFGFIQLIIQRVNKGNREFVLNCDNKIGCVDVNELALETILSNLISNAFFYSPEDTGVNISVSRLAENNRLKIAISNTSIHDYSSQDLACFFEPLWQKDASRTSAERYGLGLAIVHSYCDKIQALLSVTMKKNQQIEFTVVI